ncbi:MAG: IS110 family transposase [Rhodospirillaceae bacterium]|nr:IS110 family transposase [Rhodospirillaceae bacterium]
MPKHFDPRHAATAFDHDSTLVLALELSGKCWEANAVVPGVERRPRRRLAVGDLAELLRSIERWKAVAAKANCVVQRVVLTYEAGRDGFWIARYLLAQGIEVHVMHPASIPVERRNRRAKTDRIDLDMLLRTLLAWLRGEPRVCSMVRIPSEAEEDLRRPGRERERLLNERLQLENRLENLLCLHGVSNFKPRLKKAAERLEQVRSFAGTPLPPQTMDELRRLMVRHRLVSDQLRGLEAARDRVMAVAEPDEAERMIQILIRIVGLGTETATLLVRELFCRSFRDRRALANFVGVTGTPFRSGGMDREQGIGKNGNAHVRRIMVQLSWRWLRFQPDSALSRWFDERTGGAKGRIRKVMIVAMTRKLLIALWRYVETGEVPAGARILPA